MADLWVPADDAPGCGFCDIARGRDESASIVFDGGRTVAFLDHRPVFPGHVLLAPRPHAPTLADLPEDEVGPLFLDARLLAAAMREALGADGVFMAVNERVSQSVPHLHVHIVPRRFHDGLRGFFWPRQRYGTAEEEAAVRDAIAAAAARLRG